MTMNAMIFETRIVSSLSKIFPDEPLTETQHTSGTALMNERYSFQIAYRCSQLEKGIALQVESSLSLSVRTVGLVPSELPAYHNHDEHVLRTVPGLYPDPLFPFDEAEGLTAWPGQWRSIWITITPDENVEAGLHRIAITFKSSNGEMLSKEVFELEIISASLPEQKLLHTEWFHTDCLAVHYGVEVFSERHWEIVDSYVSYAASFGINMLLTPLFTPPLDTEIGGERPTVQLVDVCVTDKDRYAFGFDKLKRWVDMCRKNGIQYIEFSHLFTQWGAKHAPKIIADVEGEYRQIFGWDTDASGKEYERFLHQFLPELTAWIKEHGLEKQCYFHISDEPSLDNLNSYGSANKMVKDLLAEFPIIDALSNYEFYEKGLVQNPIPANNHIEPFLQHGVDGLWTYYCCAQHNQVSNRFLSMPSARNRIIGWQLYKYRIAGFLHWGFNFWYSQYSRKPIDPYRITDAGSAFPSGDAFLVYPGEDGPIGSIRLEVFYESLQDLRSLELLESLCGREQAVALLDDELIEPMTFSTYPREASWLLKRRERINRMVQEAN